MSGRWAGLAVYLGVAVAIALVILVTLRALDRRVDAHAGNTGQRVFAGGPA